MGKLKLGPAVCLVTVVLFGTSLTSHASLQVADITDMQDSNGSNALMAAGAFAGNDRGAMGTGIANLNSSFGDLGWSLAGPELAVSFFNDDTRPAETSGTVTLSQAVNGMFAIALKSAQGHSLYKFNGNYAQGDLFTFVMDGVSRADNGPMNVQGFSHGSLYIAGAAVPEPATICVWGILGLAAAAVACRRR